MGAEGGAIAAFVAHAVNMDDLFRVDKTGNRYGHIGPVGANFRTDTADLVADQAAEPSSEGNRADASPRGLENDASSTGTGTWMKS